MWAERGHEIAWCQHLLSGREWLSIPATLHPGLQVQESKAAYEVHGHNFSITFDRILGRMAHWEQQSQSIFTSAPRLAAWRPPTENDNKQDAATWDSYFLGSLQHRVISVSLKSSAADSLQITVEAYIGAVIRDWGFSTTITYTIYSSGACSIVTSRPT